MDEQPTNEPAVNNAPAPAAQPAPVPQKSGGPSLMQIGIVVGILAVAVVVTALTSDVKRMSEPGIRLVNDGPDLLEQVGGWKGGPAGGLVPEEKRLLPKDTMGTRRTYTNATSNQVSCTIILAGRDVTAIHRPELCLTGQGWKIEREYVESIPVASAPGGQLQVMRMNTTRTEELPGGKKVMLRAVFMYWFVGKHRITPHHWERIFWTSKDRVLHNTNHRWAYVLVHSIAKVEGGPEEINKTDEETFGLLKDFGAAVYPTLMAE